MTHFFEVIPTPISVPASMDTTTLRLAYEELIRAGVKVRLYGSSQSLVAAEALRESSQGYFDLLDSRNFTWTGLPGRSVLEDARQRVFTSTAEFVAISRTGFEHKSHAEWFDRSVMQ